MILDELTEFCDATSVGTPNNTTVTIGDHIDLGSGGVQDLGNGRPMYLVVQVTTAVTSGGAATVSFLLSSDSTTTIAVDGTQSSHWESDTIAVASLVAGYTLITPLPIGAGVVYERYLGFQVRENAGQALTAGNVNAFLTFDPSHWVSYADATN